MNVNHLSTLTPEFIQRTYPAYREAFEDLAPLAVQRHLLNEEEFTAIAVDTRVSKIVITGESGSVIAMSTLTTDLSAWPLIEPRYFARRWPELYADGRIWYLGFLFTNRTPAALGLLLAESSAAARTAQGMVFTDFCDFRVEESNLPEICQAIMHRTSETRIPALSRVDSQSYWVYDFRAQETGWGAVL
jgi:hypothetical protein